MNLSDLIHARTAPYSALSRKLQLGSWWYSTRALGFNMQAQTQSNWCWAATSTSVSHFYWFLSPWTQCKVAGAEQNLTTCCNSPVPGACNVPWYLDKALTRTHNLDHMVSSTVSFATVKSEIDAGRPVGARIGWSGGGGHFVCIYGYIEILGGIAEYFNIDDPIYGKSTITVADFKTKYQTTGSWTHTYITKSYIRFMPINPLLLSEEVLGRIQEKRPLAGILAGLSPERITDTSDRRLGLAHPVFTLGLHDLMRGEPRTVQTGVRVLEFSGDTPKAFYDVADAQTGDVQQVGADSPYLELLPRALASVGALGESERQYDLRLLHVPALNFEAVWLHTGNEADDKVIPLRGFHGFSAMQPISFHEALGKLHEAAKSVSQQDDSMGA